VQTYLLACKSDIILLLTDIPFSWTNKVDHDCWSWVIWVAWILPLL